MGNFFSSRHHYSRVFIQESSLNRLTAFRFDDSRHGREDILNDLRASAFNALKEDDPNMQRLQESITRGDSFEELMEEFPDAIIAIIGHLSLKKLGHFYETESATINAFEDKLMLTRGDASWEDDLDSKKDWKYIIRVKAHRKEKSHYSKNENILSCLHSFGEGMTLHRPVKLMMYSIKVKDVGAPGNKGLIRQLLQRERKGITEDDIWDYPVVQATIEYKWQDWARHYLRVEFGLYAVWTVAYVGFLLLYIELENQDRRLHEYYGFEYTRALTALLCNIVASLCMLPFILFEFFYIHHRGLRSLQFWDVIDSTAIGCQIFIIFGHLTGWCFNNTVYNMILAFQIMLLCIRLPYFARLVRMDAAYVESLLALIYNIRYFLIFILSIICSAALSFSVLYKEDVEHYHLKEKKDMAASNTTDSNPEAYNSLEDFGSFPRSLGTSFAVLLGNFDTSYVYKTSNRVLKEVAFIFFQLFIAITVLNVLIAVMTEDYTKIMKNKRTMFYRGRAKLIDKVECLLPLSWTPNHQPYVHFVVVDKPDEKEYRLSSLETDDTERLVPLLEFRQKITSLESKNNALEKNLKDAHQKLDQILLHLQA